MPDLNGRHNGRRIVIPAAILRADNPADLSYETVTALVDTGATSSGIMPHVVETLALRPHSKRLVKGAHGEAMVDDMRHDRSEEHTSELQSLMRISYAVFCLKKKTRTTEVVHTRK